ncbi:MAG: nucleotidyltransferase domain-containing protein [Candidatus Bathyarchaeota archaeon]|nr:nucleotidyltransferase domain-containing protein [Candidatus Bathyarchaeota archaeon]
MVELPQGISSTINKFVEDLAKQTTVSSIGLFGSWSRYDASPASDYDVIVIDSGGFDYELNERVEYDEAIMDITRIPKEWVDEVVSPGVDHMLHETVILYDPNGMLKRARDWVEANYRTPGRVEIRTEQYLTLADTYLSRASAAMVREDLETAALFSDVSLNPIAHVIMEVADFPITRSAFIWNLRRACEKIDMIGIYKVFINNRRLGGLDKVDVLSHLERFEGLWRGISQYMRDNREVIEGLHDRLRDEINYLTDPTMLRGLFARAEEMVNQNNFIEAANYMRGWLLPLLEGYAWLISSKRGAKLDYTSLFRTIRLHEGAAGILDEAAEIFNVKNIERSAVRQEIETSRSVITHTRKNRREMIERFVGED